MSTSSLTDVSIALPSVAEILQVMTLQAGFNSAIVVMGTTCLGAAAGIVGTFTLLRKRALMSDALAHSALPGLALAFLVATMLGHDGKTLPVLLFGATVTGILGVLAVQGIVRSTRLTEDTAIGAVLSVFFGAGIVLLSIIQSVGTGSEGGLHHFIYGQTAAMIQSDAITTLAVALLAVGVATLLLKEFRMVCFDSEHAAVQGWPVTVIDLIMMALVVIVTVIGLQSVGMILIVALLIVPAAAARFWTEKLTTMTYLSCLIGAASGYFGSCASALFPRLPAGSVIVLSAGALFFLSFLFAPCRGVLAGFARLTATRLKICQDHLLRNAYELIERANEDSEEISDSRNAFVIEKLVAVRGWAPSLRWFVLTAMQHQGFLAWHHKTGTIRLTQKGLEDASRVTRNHRLWEEYLLKYADLATSHVDRSADYVEHVLSPELVVELEQALIKKGQELLTIDQLSSVHPTAHVKDTG